MLGSTRVFDGKFTDAWFPTISSVTEGSHLDESIYDGVLEAIVHEPFAHHVAFAKEVVLGIYACFMFESGSGSWVIMVERVLSYTQLHEVIGW